MFQLLLDSIAKQPQVAFLSIAVLLFGLVALIFVAIHYMGVAFDLRAKESAVRIDGLMAASRAKQLKLTGEFSSRDLPSVALGAAVFKRANAVYTQKQLKVMVQAFGRYGYAVRPAGQAHATSFADLPRTTREDIAQDFAAARLRILRPRLTGDALKREMDGEDGFFEQLISDYFDALKHEGYALYPVDPVRHDFLLMGEAEDSLQSDVLLREPADA